MQKYLLLSEQKQLKTLLNQLDRTLYKPNTQELEQILYDIITNTREFSIDDKLSYYTNLLLYKMYPLLDNNLTLGLQFGIKNNTFEINLYGGKYQHHNKQYDVDQNTLFSLDSISKVITSIITMYQIRKNRFNLNTTINEINKEYNLNETIESILKFKAHIKTKKRIDSLSKEETISILKECEEKKEEAKKNFEYNDIGFMILRQIIPNFISELDNLLNENITYNNQNTKNITGGKITEENITPDSKGRGIIFPGHTGAYANITGLLNFFYDLLYTEKLLTNQEKEILWKQAYPNPIIYDQNGNPKIINKIAGIYKIPKGLTPNYDKLLKFDIPNNTTTNSIASAGTCGSWIMGDKIILNNAIKTYTTSILTNPYSFVEAKEYPNPTNKLYNTPLTVNNKGRIIEYSKTLNPYKEIIATYSLILEILTEYINMNNYNKITTKKLIKKIT